MCAAAPLAAAAARGQSAVTFSSPTECYIRGSLVGRDGNYLHMPCTITAQLGEPPASGTGPISIRSIHLTVPNCIVLVPLTGGNLSVSIGQFSCDAAVSGATLTGVLADTGGATNFSGTGLLSTASGTVSYTAVNLACRDLNLGGGQCTGPFNLATPGSNLNGRIDNGVMQPAAGGSRNVSFELRVSFPLVTGATWGRVDLWAPFSGTIPSGAPVCAADFNQANGLNVQDIFDFLAAWFSGQPAADFNHVSGVTVQDIFDFLAAWFAGC